MNCSTDVVLNKILALIDDNSNNIPEGDYLKLCNHLKYLHKNKYVTKNDSIKYYSYDNDGNQISNEITRECLMEMQTWQYHMNKIISIQNEMNIYSSYLNSSNDYVMIPEELKSLCVQIFIKNHNYSFTIPRAFNHIETYADLKNHFPSLIPEEETFYKKNMPSVKDHLENQINIELLFVQSYWNRFKSSKGGLELLEIANTINNNLYWLEKNDSNFSI